MYNVMLITGKKLSLLTSMRKPTLLFAFILFTHRKNKRKKTPYGNCSLNNWTKNKTNGSLPTSCTANE